MRARLSADERAERLGAGGALLVGNLALMWAQELLHSVQLEPTRQRLVHELYDAMLEEVMYGQYLDVMGTGRGADDVEAALRIIRYKTATATIERPLQLGAAVAGTGEATMDVFTRLGLPLGEAFQLRDDLLDVFGTPDGACAPGLGDLREGKRTVLLALGLRRADQTQRETAWPTAGPGRPGRAWSDGDPGHSAGSRGTGTDRAAERFPLRHVLQVLDGAGFPPPADRALRGHDAAPAPASSRTARGGGHSARRRPASVRQGTHRRPARTAGRRWGATDSTSPQDIGVRGHEVHLGGTEQAVAQPTASPAARSRRPRRRWHRFRRRAAPAGRPPPSGGHGGRPPSRTPCRRSPHRPLLPSRSLRHRSDGPNSQEPWRVPSIGLAFR